MCDIRKCLSETLTLLVIEHCHGGRVSLTVFCCVAPLGDAIHRINEQFDETRIVGDECVKGNECTDPVCMEEVVDDSDRFSNAMLIQTLICCAELHTIFHGLFVIDFLAAPIPSTYFCSV